VACSSEFFLHDYWISLKPSSLSSFFDFQDVATRVIAEGLRPEETSVSKVMTKNPVFVMGDTLAVEALQKMVQGAVFILSLIPNMGNLQHVTDALL